MIDNEPYFVGKDVFGILGYKSTRDALLKHVDDEDKNTVAFHGGIKRGNPSRTVINESGLYALIIGNKLPQAKMFKHWITNDVLPSIRKHDAYMTDQKTVEGTKRTGLADWLIQAGEQLKINNYSLTSTNSH